jgi:hypothetical protein
MTHTTVDPLDTVIAALRNHGCNPKQSRDGQWNSRCPNTAAHARGDRNPSLSVGVGVDGRALIHCQTGCPPTAVLQALGLTWPGLFPPPPVNGNDHVNGKPRVVERYDYCTAHGELVFQVERLDPKGFRQRRPDHNGGWIYNLNGIDNRPLYKAPTIDTAIAERRPIWVVEGEKDVHALERAGCAATTCAGGAGKWRPEHTLFLEGGIDVHVVADDDPPGHAHALAVRDALEPVVNSVTLYLPKAGHKDIAEHLGAGYGIDELRPWPTQDEPDVDPVDEFAHMHFIDWGEFWSEESTEEWLAEPALPKGRAVAIAATAKVGKSLFLLDIAAALATGRPALGQPARPPIHVLYCDYEMTKDDLRERLEDLGYGPDDDMSHFHYAHLPSLPPLDTAAGGQALLQAALATGAELVVIDTLARAVQGAENDADTYRQHYLHTVMLLKQQGITTVRLDHLGKDKEKGARGSSAKNDDVDVVWQMSPSDNGILLKRTHSRVPWVPDQIAITRHTDPLRHAVVGHMAWPEGTKDCAQLLDSLGVALDASRRTAQAALKAVDKGKREAIVRAALKYRKTMKDMEGAGSQITGATTVSTRAEPHQEPPEPF